MSKPIERKVGCPCRNAGGGWQLWVSDRRPIHGRVMLVMNDRGMQHILKSKFTLGGDASIAAGPVGREASANTDASMGAEILSWSRSRGVFAGVSLQGATLRNDDEGNNELYGKNLTSKEILTTEVAPPTGAEQLIAALNRYSIAERNEAADRAKPNQ